MLLTVVPTNHVYLEIHFAKLIHKITLRLLKAFCYWRLTLFGKSHIENLTVGDRFYTVGVYFQLPGDYWSTHGSVFDSSKNCFDTLLWSRGGFPFRQCEIFISGSRRICFSTVCIASSIFRLVRRVPSLESLHNRWSIKPASMFQIWRTCGEGLKWTLVSCELRTDLLDVDFNAVSCRNSPSRRGSLALH